MTKVCLNCEAEFQPTYPKAKICDECIIEMCVAERMKTQFQSEELEKELKAQKRTLQEFNLNNLANIANIIISVLMV